MVQNIRPLVDGLSVRAIQDDVPHPHDHGERCVWTHLAFNGEGKHRLGCDRQPIEEVVKVLEGMHVHACRRVPGERWHHVMTSIVRGICRRSP